MPHPRRLATMAAAVVLVVAACSGASNPTRTASSSAVSDCQADAMWIIDEGQRIDATFDAVGADIGAGDVDDAHTKYRRLLSMIDLYQYRSRQFADECATIEGRAEIETAMANMDLGMAVVREFCYQNLAPHGFDC